MCWRRISYSFTLLLVGVCFLKAVLLAGGYGTRLQPLTLRLPKVMVPVAGRPVLEHIVRACAAAGIEEVVVSLNTNQGLIENFFGGGEKFGVKVSYVYESTMSDEDKFGAIGAIDYAVRKAGVAGECIVINGDNVFYGLDLKRFMKTHSEKKGGATIAFFALSDKRDVEQYGIAQLDGHGKVMRFQEKPKLSEAVSHLASTGVYHFSEQLLKEYLPAFVAAHKKEAKRPDRVGDLWQSFVQEKPIYGHTFVGMWGDTNSPKTYVECHKQSMRFLVGKPFSQKFLCKDGDKIVVAADAKISEEAVINGPCIVDEGCVVEAGAVVGSGTHLMKGVRVEKNAVVNGSIVFRNVVVRENARVDDAIVDEETIVGSGARVEQYAIVGCSCKLGKNSVVANNSRVWPFVELSDGTIIHGDAKLDEKLLEGKFS